MRAPRENWVDWVLEGVARLVCSHRGHIYRTHLVRNRLFVRSCVRCLDTEPILTADGTVETLPLGHGAKWRRP